MKVGGGKEKNEMNEMIDVHKYFFFENNFSVLSLMIDL